MSVAVLCANSQPSRSLAIQSQTVSFRGDAQHRTRNLEIPRCAIAHLRSGPADHPGMTESGLLRRFLAKIVILRHRAAFGEPDDRLQRSIQYAAASRLHH